jgi:hypothetical protein
MPVEFMDAWIKQRSPVRFIIRPFFHSESAMGTVPVIHDRKCGMKTDRMNATSYHMSLAVVDERDDPSLKKAYHHISDSDSILRTLSHADDSHNALNPVFILSV